MLAHGRVLQHEFECLLLRPAQRVHSSVHHKSTRAQRFHGKLSHFIGWALVQSKLLTQRFRVQAPPLDISSVKRESRGGCNKKGTVGGWRGEYAATASMYQATQVLHEF
jgi:hypothetical protein